MTRIITVMALGLFFLSFKTAAQNVGPDNLLGYAAVKIGQVVPDITINNIRNYKDANGKPSDNAKISDFKGKLLILDFWATWCSPCIAMIPRIDSLQNQFKDRVQFLSVTYQSRQAVNSFFENYERVQGKSMKRPEVSQDTLLLKLFPHKSLPHFVWIGPDGIVKATTGMEEISAKNISDFLDNRIQTLKQKTDLNFHYNRQTPLLARQEIQNYPINTYFHSSLTDYIPGITGGYFRKRDANGFTRITLMNLSIPAMARSAFGESKVWFGDNRIDIHVADTVLVKPVGNEEEWIKKHTYCYEIIVPEEKSHMTFNYMQQDLQRYFSQYHIYTEKRIKKCFALVRTGKPYNFVRSVSTPPDIKLTPFGAELINCSIGIFIDRLNFYYQQLSPFPLVDQTNMDAGIDLKITASLSSITALNKSLAEYGLAFVEKELPILVLVIEDKKN